MNGWNINTFRHALRQPAVWLGVIMGIFIVYFCLAVYSRHINLYSAHFDLGNMVQVLWQSLHGRWFQMTDPGTAQLVSRMGIHTDFLLLIYLPFYAIWTSPVTLLVLQVLAVASGAIPIFLLARKNISSWVGLLFSTLYLLYPSLQWAVLFDIHAVVLVTPIILWMWWAVEKRRWWTAGILLALALLSKEEIGLTLALNAVYWLRNKETRRFAIGMFVAGLGWSALMVGWVIPHYRTANSHFALEYYAAYGNSTEHILHTMITKPWIVLHDLFRVTALHYYLNLLLPVGGLALLGLPVLLISLPEIAINVLSNNTNLRSIFFQYTSGITPYVFLAAIIGGGYAYRLCKKRFSTRLFQRACRLIVLMVVCCGAIAIWRWAPLPYTKHDHDVIGYFQKSPSRDSILLLQKLISPNEKIAATNNVAPQFSQRDRIWGFPNRLDLADVIVALVGGSHELVSKAEVTKKVNELLSDPDWELVYHRAALYYFQRVQQTPVP